MVERQSGAARCSGAIVAALAACLASPFPLDSFADEPAEPAEPAERTEPAEPTGRSGRIEPTALPPIVFADGTGLPEGGGTAREGATLYAERCASCHGAAGEGGRALELVGDASLLRSDYPDRGIAVHWPYAPPLYDYIRRAMPPDAPWSLGADETYALVARVLELNALVGPDTRVDAGFLGSLRMPNESGFERAAD